VHTTDTAIVNNQTFRQSAMSRLPPPKISYTSTTTNGASAPLNEITQSQSNVRAHIPGGPLPPQHGTKRPGADYREPSSVMPPAPFPPRGGNNVDAMSRVAAVQADPTKRKPVSEYKTTKPGAGIPKPTSIAAGLKGSSIASLVSGWSRLKCACTRAYLEWGLDSSASIFDLETRGRCVWVKGQAPSYPSCQVPHLPRRVFSGATPSRSNP
jgi:hypothetical protein